MMKIIDSIPVMYFSESSIIISRPIIIALFTIGCSKSIAKYSMNSEQQSEAIRPRTNSNGNKSKAYYVNDQFVKSLYNQDLYQVKKFIRQGADVNAIIHKRYTGDASYTPLTLAAEKGWVELIEILLDTENIIVNQIDDHGNTALHKAVCMGHDGVVQRLLAVEDIDLNAQDIQHGFTPLIVAALYNRKSIIEMLANKEGILMNKADGCGHTALHKATTSHHIDIVNILLKNSKIAINQPDKLNRNTALHLAVYLNYADIAQVILNDVRVNVNAKNKYEQTPLHIAAYNNHLALVQILLKSKHKVTLDTSNNNTTEGKHQKIKVKVNAAEQNGYTALHIAALYNNVDLCNILLQNKTSIHIDKKNDAGFTALECAKQKGHVGIVKMIMQHGHARKNVKKDHKDEKIREVLETNPKIIACITKNAKNNGLEYLEKKQPDRQIYHCRMS